MWHEKSVKQKAFNSEYTVFESFKRNWIDIEKFLEHKLILKPDDEYDFVGETDD